MRAGRVAFILVAVLLLGTAAGTVFLLRRRARPGDGASYYGPFVSGNAFRQSLELYHREIGEWPDSGPVLLDAFLDPFGPGERGDGGTDDTPPDIEPLDLDGRM